MDGTKARSKCIASTWETLPVFLICLFISVFIMLFIYLFLLQISILLIYVIIIISIYTFLLFCLSISFLLSLLQLCSSQFGFRFLRGAWIKFDNNILKKMCLTLIKYVTYKKTE